MLINVQLHVKYYAILLVQRSERSLEYCGPGSFVEGVWDLNWSPRIDKKWIGEGGESYFKLKEQNGQWYKGES